MDLWSRKQKGFRKKEANQPAQPTQPGIGGNEVINLGTLPVGTAFEIIGLLQQGPEFLNRKIYQIKILGRFAENFGRDEVRLSRWDEFYVGEDQFGQPILTAGYFRRLPESD